MTRGQPAGDHAAAELLAHERRCGGDPALQECQQQLLAGGLPRRDAGEQAVQLVEGRQVGVVHDGLHAEERGVHHPLDDGVQEVALGVEVVVEGALRRAGHDEDFLDARPVVAVP